MSAIPAVRTLGAADAPALEDFLHRHASTSLAMLSNLRTNGIVCDGYPGQAHYLAIDDRHGIQGVLALGTDDMVQVQCPNPDHLKRLVEAWSKWFSGGAKGLCGPRAQIDRLIGLLGGEALPFHLNNTEQVLSLRTAETIRPPVTAMLACRPATEAEFPLLCAWQLSLLIETMHQADSETLRQQVLSDMSAGFSAGQLFVLCDTQGQPLAMARIVLAAGDVVQIGGGYVPPEFRGRYMGRTMLAELAFWLRQRNINMLVLMTNRRSVALNQAAQAVGFRPDGDFGLVIFGSPVSPAHLPERPAGI